MQVKFKNSNKGVYEKALSLPKKVEVSAVDGVSG
jgi:hypothetical protein